jgi:GNAT superfamily N-acetyltransferase
MFELRDLYPAAAREAKPLPEGYNFRQAGPDDMLACAATAGATPEHYARRCRQGIHCYVVEADGRPVNLTWLHFGSCYVRGLGLLIRAKPTTCYLYNVFTDPGQRGKGLYKTTQQKLIQILARQGITKVIQVVEARNRIPQLTLPQFGYEHMLTISCLCVCGLKFTKLCGTDGNITARRVLWKTPRDVYVV